MKSARALYPTNSEVTSLADMQTGDLLREEGCDPVTLRRSQELVGLQLMQYTRNDHEHSWFRPYSEWN